MPRLIVSQVHGRCKALLEGSRCDVAGALSLQGRDGYLIEDGGADGEPHTSS
mgnify:CR=1 FL=1